MHNTRLYIDGPDLVLELTEQDDEGGERLISISRIPCEWIMLAAKGLDSDAWSGSR